jgi:hypothetical protein
VRVRDSASGPSSAVADAISCRSSRTEGSSDLRAGQRQPLIDRSPSRIGTTWGQVADAHHVSPLSACNRRPARGGTRRQLHTQTATAVLGSRGSASPSWLRELMPSSLKTLCSDTRRSRADEQPRARHGRAAPPAPPGRQGPRASGRCVCARARRSPATPGRRAARTPRNPCSRTCRAPCAAARALPTAGARAAATRRTAGAHVRARRARGGTGQPVDRLPVPPVGGVTRAQQRPARLDPRAQSVPLGRVVPERRWSASAARACSPLRTAATISSARPCCRWRCGVHPVTNR